MQSDKRGVLRRNWSGPTAWLLLALVAVLGIAAGVGGFTLVYAKGLSYMSTEPEVCANCHIMQPQYDAWQKSSHHAVATCADCHMPHDFVGKYLAKAINGWHHSRAFTMQDFHEPIAITPPNARILQQTCLNCHGDLVHQAMEDPLRGEQMLCVHCHRTVGHGDSVGLGGPER